MVEVPGQSGIYGTVLLLLSIAQFYYGSPAFPNLAQFTFPGLTPGYSSLGSPFQPSSGSAHYCIDWPRPLRPLIPVAKCLACASSRGKLFYALQDPELCTQSPWFLQHDWNPELTFNCKSSPGCADDGHTMWGQEHLSHSKHPTNLCYLDSDRSPWPQ